MRPSAKFARQFGRAAGVRAWLLACVLGGPLLLGCRSEPPKEERATPPRAPAASPAPTRCASGAASPLLGLPARFSGYCVDAHVDVRRYGPGRPLGLDAACEQCLDAECELYSSYGMNGLTTLGLVDEASASVEISVRVVEFQRALGAFGFFAERARQARSEGTSASAGDAWFVGSKSRAVIWRGRRVTELLPVVPTRLAELSRAVAEQAPVDSAPPFELRLLDDRSLSPSAFRVFEEDMLGLSGAGPALLAEHSGPPAGHFELVAVRRDEASAKDLLSLLTRDFMGFWQRNKTVLAARRTQNGQAPEAWYFARQGRMVLGVGQLAGTRRAGESSDAFRERALRLLDDLLRRARRTPLPEAG